MNFWKFRQTLNRAVIDKLHELQWISRREGMGSPWTQHVLNVACWCLKHEGEGYLEVGSWHGASFEAASRGNEDVPKYACEIEVLPDLAELISKTPNSSLIGLGFSESALSTIPKKSIGVFFYDGDHSYEATKNSLEHVEPYLSDQAIVIMDDLCYPWVLAGWRAGAYMLGYQIVNEFWPPRLCDPTNWWNGLGIAEFTRG